MKDWLTAPEIAQLGLPSIPQTEQGVRARATRENWKRIANNGQGGGWSFHVSSLPSKAQDELLRRNLIAPQTLPSTETDSRSQKTAVLASWQREAMEARAAILAELDRLVKHQGFTQARAIKMLIELARTGELTPNLLAQISAANARGGKSGKRTLAQSTIFNWLKARREGGVPALAPEPSSPKRDLVPAWAPAFIDLRARPSQPSLASVYEDLPHHLPEGVPMPSYDQLRRFLKKLCPVTRNMGRMGPRELKSLKAYVKRDVSELWPTAVYVADGHTFDAEVQHPIHGRPFRPEITTIIDVYTRRATGWSAGLSENTFGVLDAARNAFERSGLCDIWYVDRGAGFNNAAWDDELTGFLSRFEITKHNSLPYNSQARGVIERLHQTIWVRGAKNLPTYIGADMDREAKHKAFKITRKEIRDTGTSRLLMAWEDFIAWCQAQVDAYNDRPHSSLPKIRDPETGRKRHMSPNERWLESLESGWEPDRLTPQESEDIYRPYQRRKADRGMVRIFGNSYFHADLEAFHGEQVLVGYDIHDGSQVWVRDTDQRLICIAEFEGNKASFFPVSAAKAAHDRRVKGKLRRVDAQRDEVLAERDGANLIEHQPEQHFDPSEIAAAREKVELLIAPKAEPQPVINAAGRPIFTSDLDFARWCHANPSEVTTNDKALLRELVRKGAFRMQLDCAGLSVADLENIALKETA